MESPHVAKTGQSPISHEDSFRKGAGWAQPEQVKPSKVCRRSIFQLVSFVDKNSMSM